MLHALAHIHLLVKDSLPLHRILVQKRLDADSARLAAEMATKSVRAREAAPATTAPACAQFTFANKLLLAAVQAFVALAVVLTRKCFPANGTYKGALVSVSAQVGAKVVCTCEALGAEVALEGGRVFLDALVCARDSRAGGVGEFEDVVAIRDGRGRGATGRFGGGGVARMIGSMGRVERGEGAVAGEIDVEGCYGVCAGGYGAGDVRIGFCSEAPSSPWP